VAPFAVVLPDDVIAAGTPCLQQMVEAYQDTGGCMVAAMEVPRARTQDYGVLDISKDVGHLVEVRGMVEKPLPEVAPSTTAVIGRYILTPHVLANLSKMRKGSGGEIQLTDAIAAEIAQGRKVYGHRFEGERYDCGSKRGYLRATVAFALAREEFRRRPERLPFGPLRDVWRGRVASAGGPARIIGQYSRLPRTGAWVIVASRRSWHRPGGGQ